MNHISQPLLPLDTLRAFEAAARTGSFSSAADSLNVTHGAVSRQIAKLERWLGQRLFDRQARGVGLTPEGQRLFLRTIEALALIADSSDRWIEAKGSAVVRLASLPSVSGLWLMPRLKALEAGVPDLRVELIIDHRESNLADDGIDLALRCGRGGIPRRHSVQLFEEHCFPIAAPDLAAKIGKGKRNMEKIKYRTASWWRKRETALRGGANPRLNSAGLGIMGSVRRVRGGIRAGCGVRGRRGGHGRGDGK